MLFTPRNILMPAIGTKVGHFLGWTNLANDLPRHILHGIDLLGEKTRVRAALPKLQAKYKGEPFGGFAICWLRNGKRWSWSSSSWWLDIVDQVQWMKTYHLVMLAILLSSCWMGSWRRRSSWLQGTNDILGALSCHFFQFFHLSIDSCCTLDSSLAYFKLATCIMSPK